jgi:4'-phosphopantetheinyl transferase
LKAESLTEFGVHVLPSPVSGVDIRLADLDSLSDTQLGKLRPILNHEERARAARFHFEVDRNRFIACRALLRKILSATLDVPAPTVLIEYGECGKPAIMRATGDRNLRFNLSHSAGWAMFALAWDRELGIDLEADARLEPDENHLSDLAARILSDREFAIWHSLPDPAARRTAFLRAWTRKEALAKAIGQGILDQLRCFELVLDAGSPKRSVPLRLGLRSEQPGPGWVVHDLFGPKGFAAALAVEEKNEDDGLVFNRRDRLPGSRRPAIVRDAQGPTAGHV